MGCGISQLKLQLEEVTEENRILTSRLADIETQAEFRHSELQREILKAEKEMQVQEKEYTRLVQKQQQVHEIEQRKSTSKLEFQKSETELAREDAQKMRHSAVKVDRIEEDNKHLMRERNKLAFALKQAEEELKRTIIIFEGQKELLELEKQRVVEDSKDTIYKESENFKRKEQELNEKMAAAEERVRIAQRDARVQSEAALTIMRKGYPVGSAGFDGKVGTAATMSELRAAATAN